MGLIYADKMTGDESTYNMKANYIAAFKTAVKLGRLTKDGREVPNWWKDLQNFRELPKGDKPKVCCSPLLPQQHV